MVKEFLYLETREVKMFKVGNRVRLTKSHQGGPNIGSIGTVRGKCLATELFGIEFDKPFPDGHDGYYRFSMKPGHGWFVPTSKLTLVEPEKSEGVENCTVVSGPYGHSIGRPQATTDEDGGWPEVASIGQERHRAKPTGQERPVEGPDGVNIRTNWPRGYLLRQETAEYPNAPPVRPGGAPLMQEPITTAASYTAPKTTIIGPALEPRDWRARDPVPPHVSYGEPRGCPTPGACSCPDHAADLAAIREEVRMALKAHYGGQKPEMVNRLNRIFDLTLPSEYRSKP